ncbi:toxin-antitoxin system YwqK family antitoxin [Snuella sedimenti]|uniref:Toxin-antitoxin system YwqK family antitoxin n=1 Tax=Snuella sedimenti TaxID=2798802 RepID=A0A8J7LY30_9FLAO|nr:toxin-antitoxin system YwqK family antitoxin [Snuella sedimenti]MBJ6367871.1 toxin-antitoxin system YwqK family antitoxin [Snuella sedimenti]
MKFVIVAAFLLTSTLVISQDINQFDENGKRHGIWKKNFEGTKITRYEGAFVHGKEVGLFKFYKKINNQPVLAATKQFNENDNKAEVKFYSSQGKLISEGVMDGKTYIGTWKYYQKNSDKLMTIEHYDDSGNLVGERLVYYPNGAVAEEQHYKKGKLDGVSKWYSEKKVVLKEFTYVDGKLHGQSKYYSPKGDLVVEGAYKHGKKHGVWKYYEEGVLREEKSF